MTYHMLSNMSKGEANILTLHIRIFIDTNFNSISGLFHRASFNVATNYFFSYLNNIIYRQFHKAEQICAIGQ